jgi:hypothetical protein
MMNYFYLVVGMVLLVFGSAGTIGAPIAWSRGVKLGWAEPFVCLLMAIAGWWLVSTELGL